ncbi:hypothetical protein GCM10025787_18530 [Saccharopolyspora rosea]|uniref:Uncharacterized protein n=1 Tax=Saccharopolyspora rosea TaxID=524884 RepID=A0ABW3G3F0_9PSEU
MTREDGCPVADAIVVSHHGQLARLRAENPAAADVAVVTGDLCYDRLRTSAPWRRRYRRAFGVDDDQVLVAVSSTWRPESLLGSVPELYERLLAELPADRFRVAAILHPNIRDAHQEHEVRRWFAPLRRAGLAVVPPERGWRATLVAADHLIGDHGSVTAYGAASGLTTLLAAFPESRVASGSVVDLLGRLAPRLRLDEPLLPQLRKAAAEHTPGRYGALHERITSFPDEAAERTRSLCYSMLGLDPPRGEPVVPPDDLAGLPDSPWYWRPTAAYASTSVHSGRSVQVDRFPAELLSAADVPDGAHLAVTADHPGRRLAALADVVVLADAEGWGRQADGWLRDTLDSRPGAQLAAAVRGDECTVLTRWGHRYRLREPGGSTDPALLASAVFGWLAAGGGDPTGLVVNGRAVEVS